MPYSYRNCDELVQHADKLRGCSLLELYGSRCSEELVGRRGKGVLGDLVEELHYGIENNNRAEPDIAFLGVEIKTNPLVRNADGTFRPKEVVSLGMIDFSQLVQESFSTSAFLKKNQNILFNMYHHECREQNVGDYKFILVLLRSLPPQDLNVIRRDWETIKSKAIEGKANELSKRDTKYLAAGTKGSANQQLQPYVVNGDIYYAKRRALVLKSAYVRHILSEFVFNEDKGYFERKKASRVNFHSILQSQDDGDIERAVIKRFSPFLEQTDIEIAAKFGAEQAFELGKDKARWHMNTSLILTGERKKYLARYVEEFSKSGLTVKTIRVAENYMPLEEVSFRTQPYTLHKDSEWEDSPLYDEMTSPFLWVVYQESMRGMILAKVFFWSMPLTDLNAVKEKWLRLKQMLLNGDYRPSYFMSEDSFYYLKIKDKKGGANRKVNDVSATNLSHWFRKNYVMNIIANSPS